MKLKTKFTGKRLIAGMLGLTLVISLALTIALPALGQVINPLYELGQVDINGAWFEQYTLEGSTGTGTFHPFLQVNKIGGHAQSPVYGFSTDLPLSGSDAAPFCECTGKGKNKVCTSANHSVFYTTEPTYQPRLDELPQVTSDISGINITYMEFMLDSNQNKGGDSNLLTWDQLKIFQTNSTEIRYTDLGVNLSGTATTPLAWDMDELSDQQLIIDGQFGSGSGQGDVRILVPADLFDPSYEFVIVWVSFGGDPNESNPCDDDANEASIHPNNDGFEEFGYVEKPLGCLTITKDVSLGDVQNPGDIDATFHVHVTGPGVSEDIDFVMEDGILQQPDSVTLNGLTPGSYTVTEDDAGPEWSESVSDSPVSVVAGVECAEVTVTNTYVPGCLEITKVIDWDDLIGDHADVPDVDFTINVAGPSYPAASGGLNLTFRLIDGEIQYDDEGAGNNTHCVCDLIPGDYTVTEPVVPEDWELLEIINGSPATVDPGDVCGVNATEVIVRNAPIPADVSVEKTGEITYTIIVYNDGPTDAANVTMNDPLPGNLGWSISDSSGFTIGPTIVGGSLTGTIGSLASGHSASVTVEAEIDGHSDSPLLGNNVTVSTTTLESDDSNNIDWADIGPKP